MQCFSVLASMIIQFHLKVNVEKNIESFACKIKGETVATVSTYFRLKDVIESGLLAEHFFIGKNVGQKLHVCQRKKSGTYKCKNYKRIKLYHLLLSLIIYN